LLNLNVELSMQRLKTLSLVALFAAIIATLLMSVSGFVGDRIKDIDRTQALRSRMQAQIQESIHNLYAAQIHDTQLLSRCGITAYVATMRNADGSEFTLFYDIDSGKPIQQDLLNGCSA
jgi:Na+-translocating ferredoxin:NAD+ oxidoreductase RnfG subunit